MTNQYSAHSPLRVNFPLMEHRWEQLTFMHWSYSPEDVQKLLPAGLYVEPFEDRAWVGLVPFNITVQLPHVPPLPWLSRFPETNVRTYVHDASGRRGIWFFSLDADRLAAVVAARVSYRLPYLWGKMAVTQVDNVISYECERRWPGPRGATCNAMVEIGDPYRAEELTDFDHFLTARWTLFSAHKRGLHFADAVHDPWPLQKATVAALDQSVVMAAGLPEPIDAPITHYSESVRVRIGRPHRVSL